MAAISADCSVSEKRWGRVVSFNLSSGVLEKARKAASVSQKVMWSTGKAAWIAGASFLFLVAPLIIQMDRDQQQQGAVPDLEGGDHHHHQSMSTAAVNPDSPSVLK